MYVGYWIWGLDAPRRERTGTEGKQRIFMPMRWHFQLVSCGHEVTSKATSAATPREAQGVETLMTPVHVITSSLDCIK